MPPPEKWETRDCGALSIDCSEAGTVAADAATPMVGASTAVAVNTGMAIATAVLDDRVTLSVRFCVVVEFIPRDSVICKRKDRGYVTLRDESRDISGIKEISGGHFVAAVTG